MSSDRRNSSSGNPTAGKPVQKFSRFKRIKNYWEVIYEPSARPVTKKYDWDTGNTTGVKYCVCDAKSLAEKMTSRGSQRWKVQGFSFRYCDFIGTYPEGVTFKDCEFEACDLGLTTWKNVKFTGCKFKKTSLTLATFEHCQFLGCTWIDISISGTETRMLDTTISNAESFVSAAYTNLDLETLKQFSKDPQFQKMRLEETKLKLARTIMICNERHGDDAMYYEAIKTYLVQSLRARQEKIKYRMLTDKKTLLDSMRCKLLSMEAWMLKVSGSINGWGSSLSRPAVVGLGIVVLYALLYSLLNVKEDVFKAAMAAFDVTLLVGYTKHAKEESEWLSQILYASNALFGLWWYAIFVPTVINRISRVR